MSSSALKPSEDYFDSARKRKHTEEDLGTTAASSWSSWCVFSAAASLVCCAAVISRLGWLHQQEDPLPPLTICCVVRLEKQEPLTLLAFQRNEIDMLVVYTFGLCVGLGLLLSRRRASARTLWEVIFLIAVALAASVSDIDLAVVLRNTTEEEELLPRIPGVIAQLRRAEWHLIEQWDYRHLLGTYCSREEELLLAVLSTLLLFILTLALGLLAVRVRSRRRRRRQRRRRSLLLTPTIAPSEARSSPMAINLLTPERGEVALLVHPPTSPMLPSFTTPLRKSASESCDLDEYSRKSTLTYSSTPGSRRHSVESSSCDSQNEDEIEARSPHHTPSAALNAWRQFKEAANASETPRDRGLSSDAEFEIEDDHHHRHDVVELSVKPTMAPSRWRSALETVAPDLEIEIQTYSEEDDDTTAPPSPEPPLLDHPPMTYDEIIRRSRHQFLKSGTRRSYSTPPRTPIVLTRCETDDENDDSKSDNGKDR